MNTQATSITRTCKINFDKIKSLLTSEDKTTFDGSKLISYEKRDRYMVKEVEKKLPLTKCESLFLGMKRGIFSYDISWSDTDIVVITEQCDALKKYFKYYLKIIFRKLDEEFVSIDIEAESSGGVFDGLPLQSSGSGSNTRFINHTKEYVDLIVELCL